MKPIIGIVVGNILDFFVSAVLGAIVVAILTVPQVREAAAHGLHPNAQAMMASLTSSPSFLIATFATGAIGSLLGGFVAAWIAGQTEILCGALSAAFGMIEGVRELAAGTSGVPLPLMVVSILLSPLLGVLGAQIRMSMAGRR